MRYDYLRKQLLKDSFIDLAFKRYLEFKKSSSYDEAYKKEILSGLHEFLKGQEVSELTVYDIVKKLQKENPPTGSFVHWSNTGDLLKYAEDRPDEVADLLNKLWNNSEPDVQVIEEVIEMFREKGKEYSAKISLGAPLFGYLLAAKNYHEFPLYKQEVFIDLKKSYGIELKLGTVGNNYVTYYQLCEIALEHLGQFYPGLTMLDIQDFFFCSTQYSKLMVEAAVEYLFDLAIELNKYMEQPALLLETLTMFDKETLIKLREIYRNQEKINLIKYLVLDRIIEQGSITIDDMEVIKNEVKVKYETNILQAWNNFTILFQLFYSTRKQKVQEELRKIHTAIRQMQGLEEFRFVEEKVLNGFNWNQHFGGSECWLAVYKEGHKTHRNAAQFFVSIEETGIRYGLLFGDQHPKRGNTNLSFLPDSSSFSYEDFHKKIVEVSGEFKDEESLEKEPDGEFGIIEAGRLLGASEGDKLTVETWLDLLNNEVVFGTSDLVYLHKMYELGGEATPTQLANALGKHYSSFNTPVVQLAKRVIGATGIQPVVDEEGKTRYWNILFNGEYVEDNHFLWRLKPNLKNAIEIQYASVEAEKYVVYTEEDFLREVFIDKAQYETIKNLLKYKSNLILQGPPGVGKTYVSKRLVYSLMGVKDAARVEMVQFHQNYAYEDFVMGYRPDGNGFSLQFGIFYEFCQKAIKNPEQDYYFIIDEINRGNLSKVFGELFMLLERDKRDEFVTMSYSGQKFTVPSNVYLIGTMNTADRSLAQLDVALRRRFAFVTLSPAFNEKWRRTIIESGVSVPMVERIMFAVNRFNKEIVGDFQLGSGYAIGHSFFTSKPEHMDEQIWFEGIIRYEILPLLEEYFFDRPEVAKSLLEDI